METIKRELIVEDVGVEKITQQETGVVFISAGGKRRRLDNFVKVNDKKRKYEDDEDEFVSRKMRRILDIDEIDYEMVEAEMRVERAKMMADAEEKERKHQQQLQLQKQQQQKQKQKQQRLKYTLKKQQQQQQEIKNTEWLRIQNKRRKEAREKADYDDYIREKQRQQMVSYNNMCIESDEWLSEQKRKRQFLKVFENSNANDLICEQKQRRIVADRVSEMKDFMFINRK